MQKGLDVRVRASASNCSSSSLFSVPVPLLVVILLVCKSNLCAKTTEHVSVTSLTTSLWSWLLLDRNIALTNLLDKSGLGLDLVMRWIKVEWPFLWWIQVESLFQRGIAIPRRNYHLAVEWWFDVAWPQRHQHTILTTATLHSGHVRPLDFSNSHLENKIVFLV